MPPGKKGLSILSWNVNGIRACLRNGFPDWVKTENPDILGLQETKARPEQLGGEIAELSALNGYRTYWNPAERPGYSGTGLFTRPSPADVRTKTGVRILDGEGRVIRADYDTPDMPFTLFNVYFPNGQMDGERLKYKMDFYAAFLELTARMISRGQNLVVMGDVNTAHREIDLVNPKENSERSGFLPEERAWIDRFLESGFTDTFRLFHPEPGRYSWWTYRFNARARNVGWRIDYVFVSKGLAPRVLDAFIRQDVKGSDHCPVGIVLDVKRTA